VCVHGFFVKEHAGTAFQYLFSAFGHLFSMYWHHAGTFFMLQPVMLT